MVGMKLKLGFVSVDQRFPPGPRADVIVHGPAAGARMLGLVDSGADASLIPYEIAEQIGIDWRAGERQRMWGNGHWNEAWLLPEPVRCQLACFPLEFEIRPVVGDWPGLVLGADFFRQFRVTFDWREEILWLEPYGTPDPSPLAAAAIAAAAPLVVTNPGTTPIRFLEWGIGYDLTSPMQLDSDSLVTTGFAGVQATLTGAYDPDASGNNVITASLLSIPQACCGTGDQPHTGRYRVKLRCYAVATTDMQVRLAWRNGEAPITSNQWVSPLISDRFAELDLGLIDVNGNWSGRIEAYGSGTLHIDTLRFVPISGGYAKITALPTDQPGVVVGHDEFTGTTAGGGLNARAAPAGGSWATTGGTGDFLFVDSGASARR